MTANSILLMHNGFFRVRLGVLCKRGLESPHVRHVRIEAEGRPAESRVDSRGPLPLLRILQVWVIDMRQAAGVRTDSWSLAIFRQALHWHISSHPFIGVLIPQRLFVLPFSTRP